MKKIINILKYGVLSLLFTLSISCNEQEFLDEVPLDFFSPENSYRSMSNFESALTDLYARVRFIHHGSEAVERFSHFLATDIAFASRRDANRFGDYNVWLVPTNAMVQYHWNAWYKVISNANTILSRIEGSELNNEQKMLVTGEAKFFRAFAYRYLVYIYGGVPLLTEEVTSPQADFIRASKEHILNQIAEDAADAAANLPSIDKVKDGKVSNIVAQHLLAETYVAQGKWDQAIAAASVVINDPNTALMTARFGKKTTQNPSDKFLKFTQPGDPFWDLFQAGNQNRSAGNKEALWVIQMETDIVGGLLSSGGISGNALERWASPIAYLTFRDPANREGSTTFGASNYNAGGRGVSFMENTRYFLFDLWQSDWDNDIRNAPHNIVRDFIYDNPASAYYGTSATKPDGTSVSPTWKSQNWRWYPYPSKITTPGDHPEELFHDKSRDLLKTSAGSTYRDMYLLRLPETYLLRAEAYLGKGDKNNAANDINVVRNRANATPVTPGDVTLDYILDERARELVYEEQRRITLSRTGTLVARVRKYNFHNGDEIQAFHALWPIPFADIEANKGAVIEQNPGYN